MSMKKCIEGEIKGIFFYTHVFTPLKLIYEGTHKRRKREWKKKETKKKRKSARATLLHLLGEPEGSLRKGGPWPTGIFRWDEDEATLTASTADSRPKSYNLLHPCVTVNRFLPTRLWELSIAIACHILHILQCQHNSFIPMPVSILTPKVSICIPSNPSLCRLHPNHKFNNQTIQKPSNFQNFISSKKLWKIAKLKKN